MFSDEEMNLVRETAAVPSEAPLVEQTEPPSSGGPEPDAAGPVPSHTGSGGTGRDGSLRAGAQRG